jgi:hypothetical protein
MTQKIKALKDFPYGQVDRIKGEKFEAEEGHAKILITIGLAEKVKDKNGRKERSGTAKNRRGPYRRRDMRAE